MSKRVLFVGVGALLGLILLAVGWKALAQPYAYQGSLIEPAMPAAEIESLDQNGNLFRLSEQRGKVILLAFGYTNCPDVCPTTLAQFKQIKSQLGAQAAETQFVLITVDPERDTPQRMKLYLDQFDPSFIGISGDRSELEPIWKNYFVYQAKRDTGSAAGYMVDHTSRVYAIDKEGNLRLTYPYEIGQDAIFADVRHLVQE
jgi:protein SCO1/2